KLKATPTAKSTVRMSPVVSKPNNRAFLEIRCTGINCNAQTEYEWCCEKCETNIEYCFDDGCCYCNCGKADLDSYEFQCTDPRHGLGYEKHDPTYLQELVKNMRPFKELNDSTTTIGDWTNMKNELTTIKNDLTTTINELTNTKNELKVLQKNPS